MNLFALQVIIVQIHAVLVIHVQIHRTVLQVHSAHLHPVQRVIIVLHPAKLYFVRIDIFVHLVLFHHRAVEFLIFVHPDQSQRLRVLSDSFLFLLFPLLRGQSARLLTKREIEKETNVCWPRK